MSQDTDLDIPLIFILPDFYEQLDDMHRPEHLWHALQFIKTAEGKAWLERAEFNEQKTLEEKIAKVIDATSYRAAGICRRFTKKFESEGRWKDRDFHLWPRNRRKDDPRHYVDMGALPPRILCFPEHVPYPKDSIEFAELLSEMYEWLNTPAAHVILTQEQREKWVKDYVESQSDVDGHA